MCIYIYIYMHFQAYTYFAICVQLSVNVCMNKLILSIYVANTACSHLSLYESIYLSIYLSIWTLY